MNIEMKFVPPAESPRAQAVVNGMQVFTSRILFEAMERVERRVRGGYMNRWLVRQVTHERVIKQHAIHDRSRNCIYCHPDTLPALLKELS